MQKRIRGLPTADLMKRIRLAKYFPAADGELILGETGAMWDTGQCWTEQLKYVKLV
jgi:hypothetical protein